MLVARWSRATLPVLEMGIARRERIHFIRGLLRLERRVGCRRPTFIVSGGRRRRSTEDTHTTVAIVILRMRVY